MGAGLLCGGLDGKAGPHTRRVGGAKVAVASARSDTTEGTAAGVARGTKPPPNRRDHGGMIIGHTGISSLEIVILLLIILFGAVCAGS